jgi:hypothetical protein
VRLRLLRHTSLLVLGLLLAAQGRGQNADTLSPQKSQQKADQLLKQLIAGLGGERFLQAKGIACNGRRAQFGHNGALTGYVDFKDYWQYPDKNRVDYAKHGNIVDLYAGDQGWTLDRGGVSEEPATAITDFQERIKRNAFYTLRYRLKEKGLNVAYAGDSVVDLKHVDWVELTDPEQRTMRFAIDREAHLLIRSVVQTEDEATREKSEEVTVYSNYQLKDGVQTPMQISRERDGRRVFQTFYENCQYNPDLPAEFFTKAALEKRFNEVGGKKEKEKDKKKKEQLEPAN